MTSTATRRLVNATIVFSALLALAPFDSFARTGRDRSGSNLEAPEVVLQKRTDTSIQGAHVVRDAGDVNDDGTPDAIADVGRDAFVVFLEPHRTAIDLSRGTAQGFVIRSAQGKQQGIRRGSAAAAGDVNGDGYGDVIVGGPTAMVEGQGRPGAAYVVFGKADSEPVELGSFDKGTQGQAGFKVAGANHGDEVGTDVGGIGDMNLDGLADVIVSAPFAGAAYVVFGRTTTEEVDLGMFELGIQGTHGWRIDAPEPFYNTDYDVAGAGDVNNDGMPDVILGVIVYQHSPGSAYVVFGKIDPAPVDVRVIESRGFAIRGARRNDFAGYAVDGAGDANGDGLDDLVVGASRWTTREHEGSAYVVFGKSDPTTVKLSELGSGGYRLLGRSQWAAGYDVAGMGDANGDGLGDIVLGAGEKRIAFVVYGAQRDGTLRLDRLGDRGFMFRDSRKSVYDSDSVAGLGDIDGDGLGDVAIGSEFSEKAPFIVWRKP